MHADLILLALSPLFLLIIASEWLYWHRQHQPAVYELKDSLCNAALALLHQGADKLAWLLTLPLFQNIATHHRLFDLHPGVTSTLLLFLLQDLLYYGFHRASHRVRWLWAAHSVHHSSTRMNFTTALRQSLMYPLAGMWAFWLPLLNLGFQFFVHTRLCPSLGWLELLFNTPSIHRCHHARNPRYIDRNYAGVLVIWDRLFGSYVAEDFSDPCVYGTVKPVNSFNPVTVTFSEWRDMLSEVRTATCWHDRFALIFSSPERAAQIAEPHSN
jgi:sterol desaturase/sphingolipid hydroxylase (fatty acid hydroxylase superfamily)